MNNPRRVVANPQQLFGTGPNSSFGNHVFHPLFAYNLARSLECPLVVPPGSNLERLFDLSKYSASASNPQCVWRERAVPEGFRGYLGQLLNVQQSRNLLRRKIELPTGDVMVEGWFQGWSLVPPENPFGNGIPFRSDVWNSYETKYPDLSRPGVVGIHYRGTDFASFGQQDRRLPVHYYRRAFTDLRSSAETQDFGELTLHLFSDEPETISRYAEESIQASRLRVASVVVHQDPYHEDWLGLHRCHAVISSNSSFCVSATLYNRGWLAQPKGMLNLGGWWQNPADSRNPRARQIGFRKS